MDLPILNQLEKIYPRTDTGADAIRKLVRNQNLIEQGIKEIDDINDLDEVREQINVLNGSKFLADYYDLNDFMVNGKYSFNGRCLNLPSTNITDGYIEFTPYGRSSEYGQQEVLGFSTNGKQFKYFRLLNNGVWQPWQQIATTSVAIPTAANGWTQFSGHQPIKLIKTGNIVNLVGFVNVGVTTANTIMLINIPVEHRPPQVQVIKVADLDVRVLTDGTMIIVSSKSTDYACYNGICWEV